VIGECGDFPFMCYLDPLGVVPPMERSNIGTRVPWRKYLRVVLTCYSWYGGGLTYTRLLCHVINGIVARLPYRI